MTLALAFQALHRLVHVHGTILFDLFVLLANICKLNIVKKKIEVVEVVYMLKISNLTIARWFLGMCWHHNISCPVFCIY